MMGGPVSLMMPRLGEAILSQMIFAPVLQWMGLGSYALRRTERLFRSMVEDYPTCFLGHTGLAWTAQLAGDLSLAERHLNEAYRLAETRSEWSELAKALHPGDKERFLHPEAVLPPSTITPVAENVRMIDLSCLEAKGRHRCG